MDGEEKREITESTPPRPEWDKENPQDRLGRKEHESLQRVEEKRVTQAAETERSQRAHEETRDGEMERGTDSNPLRCH